MGWLLGKAMLENRGFFWPWLIHICLDVVVFAFIAIGSITPAGEERIYWYLVMNFGGTGVHRTAKPPPRLFPNFSNGGMKMSSLLINKIIISAVILIIMAGCAPQVSTGTPTRVVGEQTSPTAPQVVSPGTGQPTSTPTHLAPTRPPNDPVNLAAAQTITDKNMDHMVDLGSMLRGFVMDMASSLDGRWLAVCAPWFSRGVCL